MTITDKLLEDGEYFKEVIKKDTIYVHHSAGSHRPDWVIDGWERDKAKNGNKLPVGTAYIIGGLSTTDRNADWDGKIIRAFDDKYWAHHLGCTTANNKILNQKSIGIEICNYGPIIKTKEGIFLNYVNKEVPADMVEELTVPFRNFKYYHKYTDAQIQSLKELLISISTKHGIDLKQGLLQFAGTLHGGLEVNQAAMKGVPGLWSHSNVRSDKFDCWPQSQLLQMIKTL